MAFEEIAINTTAQKLETIANMPIDDVPIAESENLVKSGGVKSAIDEGGGSADIDKPIHTTLNVEIEDDGFGGYRADHNDNEINNHRNAGGLVQAKYYNQTENQTYTYYYSTMESDRKPTFIRTFINADGKTEQILASVGNDKKVSVERRVSSGGVSQEYVESTFAPVIKNTASGEVIAVDDVSSVPHKVEVKASSKNLFDYNQVRPSTRLIDLGNGVYKANVTSHPYVELITTSLNSIIKKGVPITFSFDADNFMAEGKCGIVIFGQFKTPPLNFRQAQANSKEKKVTLVLDEMPLSIEYVELRFEEKYPSLNDTQSIFYNIQLKQDTEMSSANVLVQGKNLFNSLEEKTDRGSAVEEQTTNKIVVSQNDTTTWGLAKFKLPNVIIGKTITISAKLSSSAENKARLVCAWEKKTSGVFQISPTELVYSGQSPKYLSATGVITPYDLKDYDLYLYVYSNAGVKLQPNTKYTATYEDIQIEVKDMATDFEIYKEPIIYPIGDDLTAEVNSISPNMTILADKQGIILDTSYNADTKLYIDNKIAKMTASTQALTLGE